MWLTISRYNLACHTVVTWSLNPQILCAKSHKLMQRKEVLLLITFTYIQCSIQHAIVVACVNRCDLYRPLEPYQVRLAHGNHGTGRDRHYSAAVSHMSPRNPTSQLCDGCLKRSKRVRS